ncbi:dihydroorotate dehydrogenase [Spirochaetia bacterium]|nr:dihydroorotate dehydrogenase [Spirochaetia bacterium]
MVEEELYNLIAQVQRQKCETTYLEVKSARKGCPKVIDTLSSFSNQSGGGVILFGIDESNHYEICGVYNPAELQKKLDEQCQQMEPIPRPLITTIEIDGKIIVSAEVEEIEISRRPCYYRGTGRIGGSYVRTGDGDHKMTEYEIYSYEAYRNSIQDELRIIGRAVMEDLSADALEEYLIRLRRSKPNLAGLPMEKLLKLQGFTDQGRPTLAGTLLFGEYPQAFFPGLCITAVVIPGTEMGDTGEHGERFIDNQRIEGTIPQMLEEAMRFIRRNCAVRTIIDPVSALRKDKAEYPLVAIREILLNALLHRDYSIHTDTAPIVIQLYRNRLVVENSGGLYGKLTLDTLGAVTADTRNPFLANAMEVLGATENRFSGIPTIRKSMEEQGLPPPQFEVLRGVFRVTLYNSSTYSLPSANTGAGYAAEPSPAYGVEDPLQHKTLPAPQTAWEPMATALEDDILDFCSAPRTRQELSARFPNLTTVYLMTAYVNPLAEQGRLELSIPQKPKSKNQRFRTKRS